MKLALVTHNVVKGDGQGRVNYEIARHVSMLGGKVFLVADTVDPDLLDLGCQWIPVIPILRKPNLLKVCEFASRATHAVHHLPERVDVVHGNGFTLRCGHAVNTAHMVHSAWEKSPANRRCSSSSVRAWYHLLYTHLNARWETSAYGRAKTVVAVSRRVQDELAGLNPPPRDIRVIRNGVDLTEFAPGAVDRAEVGLPASVPMLLFAGDLQTGLKNLDSVLEAVRMIPGCHLAVVGTIGRSPFPKMAAELQITDRVHFLGFRTDLPKIMRAADVFVFPSRYESFSLVLLEAMASGLPVITARTVGAAELVGDAGVVLENPNDVQGLASSIRELIANEDMRRCMGVKARAVAEQHSWERMASEYVRLYEEMAA